MKYVPLDGAEQAIAGVVHDFATRVGVKAAIDFRLLRDSAVEGVVVPRDDLEYVLRFAAGYGYMTFDPEHAARHDRVRAAWEASDG